MKLRPILASLFLTAFFSGCATFTDAEIGQIRQHGVTPAVVGKMKDGTELTPSDVIELTRRGVPDSFIIRQIEDAGVNYVLKRDDVKKLLSAHVSQPVLEALEAQSNDYVHDHTNHVGVYASVPGYPDDYYYGGYPYYPYAYGGVVVRGGYGPYYGARRYWR